MSIEIIHGDCRTALQRLPDRSVHCCITPPPYFGLRDYDVDAQIGLEETPDQYVAEIVGVFREVRRVLRDDGTLWLNLGDSYANDGKWGGHTGGKHAAALHASPIGRNKRYTGLKPKDLIGIPWMVAFALRADGWFLRQDNIWHKPNPMPESVRDRCTKAHEYLFMLSKSATYYFDNDEMQEEAVSAPPGNKKHRGAAEYAAGDEHHRTKVGLAAYAERERKSRGVPPRHAAYVSSDQSGLDTVPRGKRNKRSVWTVPTRPFKEAHFATYPPDLIDPCVRAACPPGGVILDPFFGAGTTALVAEKHGRHTIGIELNSGSIAIARTRLGLDQDIFA